MTKVHINGLAHEVTVEHDGADLSYVVEKAQKLWDDTKPAHGGAGRAVGYLAERHGTATGWADLGQGEQPNVNARVGGT